jgi:hypothetical protein
MPTPVATAGRDTRERADTASQSVISSRVPDGRCSCQWRTVQPPLDVLPGGARPVTRMWSVVAARRPSLYHRSSMIRAPLIPAAEGPAKALVATPRPFAIIAPKRR